MADSEMRFSLVRKQVVITLDTEGGSHKVFIRELTGKDRDGYLSYLGKKMRYDSEGKPQGMKSFDGLQIALLVKCLYDEDDHRVKESVIEAYPAAVVTALYEVAEELSALTDGAAEEVGND